MLSDNIPTIGAMLDVPVIHLQCVAFCNCQPRDKNRTVLLLNQGVAMLCAQCNHIYTLDGVNNGKPLIRREKVNRGGLPQA